MIKKSIYFTILLCLTLVFSCKEETQNANSELLFHSLQADKDSIQQSEVLNITANAEGDKLNFSWSVDAGDIVGSGSTVQYIAGPCVMGKININCKVSDVSKKSLTKSIVVTVY